MGLDRANARLEPYAAGMPARAVCALGLLRRKSVRMPSQSSSAAESQRIGPLHRVSSDETASRPSNAAVAKRPCADAAPTPVAKPYLKPSAMLRWTQTSDMGPNGRATDKPSVTPATTEGITSRSGQHDQGGRRWCAPSRPESQDLAHFLARRGASWIEPPARGSSRSRVPARCHHGLRINVRPGLFPVRTEETEATRMTSACPPHLLQTKQSAIMKSFGRRRRTKVSEERTRGPVALGMGF